MKYLLMSFAHFLIVLFVLETKKWFLEFFMHSRCWVEMGFPVPFL